MKCFLPNEGYTFLKEIKQVVNGLCIGYGATAEIEYDLGGPPLINDEKMSQYAEEIIVKTFGNEVVIHVEPTMSGEDFSSYLEQKPGAFIYIGMGGEKSAFPHHHPRFDIDEEVLPTGIELFIQLVKNFK